MGLTLLLRAFVGLGALALAPAPPAGAWPAGELPTAAVDARVAPAVAGPTADSVGRVEAPTAPARVDGRPRPIGRATSRTAAAASGPDTRAASRLVSSARIARAILLHNCRIKRPRMRVDGPPDH